MANTIGRTSASGRSGGNLILRRILMIGLPILILFGGVVLMGVLSSLKPKPEKAEETVSALPVLTMEARSETVNLTVQTQGEVKPRREIALVPEISGKISYVSPKFLEGKAFNRGDVLIQIDPADFRLRVTQAKSAVAQAERRIASEQAESDLARQDWIDLGQQGEPSSLTLREPQLAEARAALDAAEAQLAEANLKLSRASIRAPFAGRVKSKSADLGQYVSPGAGLGMIFSTDIVDIPLPLTDDELFRLGLSAGFVAKTPSEGLNVELTTLVGGSQKTWSGKLTRTDSAFDSNTRVLFGYVEVTDPYGKGADNGTALAAGLFVTANVEGRSVTDAVVVPRTALRGKDEVYVLRGEDEIEIRKVSVLSSDRNEALFSSGLSAGDVVITSPIRGATDGMKVEPVDKIDTTNNSSGGSDETVTDNLTAKN